MKRSLKIWRCMKCKAYFVTSHGCKSHLKSVHGVGSEDFDFFCDEGEVIL